MWLVRVAGSADVASMMVLVVAMETLCCGAGADVHCDSNGEEGMGSVGGGLGIVVICGGE